MCDVLKPELFDKHKQLTWEIIRCEIVVPENMMALKREFQFMVRYR